MFKPNWGPRIRRGRRRVRILPGEAGILIAIIWISLAAAMVGGLIIRAFGW
jgi:hypothetical protein